MRRVSAPHLHFRVYKTRPKGGRTESFRCPEPSFDASLVSSRADDECYWCARSHGPRSQSSGSISKVSRPTRVCEDDVCPCVTAASCCPCRRRINQERGPWTPCMGGTAQLSQRLKQHVNLSSGNGGFGGSRLPGWDHNGTGCMGPSASWAGSPRGLDGT